MNDDETEFKMVQRHVREGRGHVKRQRELVAHMQTTGGPIEMAKALLSQFEASQQQHEAHLARLESKRDAATDEI